MASTGLPREENGDIIAQINITPLTDIFLVLLIIFMITSSAIVESGGKVHLPKVARTRIEPQSTTVTITADREIFINQKKVTQESLKHSLRETLKISPNKAVILKGDKELLFGEIVKLLSLVNEAGASKIAIAAQEEKN